MHTEFEKGAKQTYNLICNIPAGYLYTIAYKLTNNVIPDVKGNRDLATFVLSYLIGAHNALAGQTLPADLHHIDIIEPAIGSAMNIAESFSTFPVQPKSKLSVQLNIVFPTDEEFEKRNPQHWINETRTISDPIIYVQPYTWGDKTGMAVYFLRSEGGGTYWHFTTGTIMFIHTPQ